MAGKENTTLLSRIIYKTGDPMLSDGLTVARPIEVEDTKDVLIHVAGLQEIMIDVTGKKVAKAGFELLARWRHEVGTDADIDHEHDWFNIPIIGNGCSVCLHGCNNYIVITTPGEYMLRVTHPIIFEQNIHVFAKGIHKGSSVLPGHGVFYHA